MTTVSRRAIALTLAGGLSLAITAFASNTARGDDKELVSALKQGGLVIVIRHGATFNDQADTDPLHPENIAAQRQLNDAGKAAAKALGDAFAKIGVPVGKVYTSQFNRAYETAMLAGFKNIEKTADITEGGLVVSPNENNRRTKALRTLISAPPQAGTNVVLVTHKPNIIDALGKDWLDVKEGEASIFRPEAGGFKLIARVQMSDWTRIAGGGA